MKLYFIERRNMFYVGRKDLLIMILQWTEQDTVMHILMVPYQTSSLLKKRIATICLSRMLRARKLLSAFGLQEYCAVIFKNCSSEEKVLFIFLIVKVLVRGI
jgi:hypothetical protein